MSPGPSHDKSTPLLPSSPGVSSPLSSHSRPIVNITPSTKPMGSEANEEEDAGLLPYKLPPGPYSNTKPKLTYAALIGQAILASPEHRLTLPEIYDYITTVYPYFKRSEKIWQTSIRHVLTTAIVFRKVQRDHAPRRSLWAIFDQDLDCFIGGGFRKELCADMQEQKEKARLAKRQLSAEDAPTQKPKQKKLKTGASQEQVVSTLDPQMGISVSTPPAVTYPRPTLFPGPRPLPGTYHQPYYGLVHAPHAVSTDVKIPVLRPAIFNTAPTPLVSRPFLSTLCIPKEQEESPSPSLTTPSSSVSLPVLTPNNSSSSPSEESDDLDPTAQGTKIHRASASVSPKFDISTSSVVPEEDSLDALAPGVTLLNAKPTAGENEASKSKGKEKAADNDSHKKPSLPPAPESPTLTRQTLQPRTQIPKPSTPTPSNVSPTSVTPHATPRSNSGTQAWVTSAMSSFLSFLRSIN